MKLGRIKSKYDRRDYAYADLRPRSAVLPNIPPVFGHGNDFLNENWLMLGNGPDSSILPEWESARQQGCGDCVWAGAAHEVMEMDVDSGKKVSPFTGQVVVKQYSEYSGYNPVNGANDEGSEPRAVLNWRREKGLIDASGTPHKIGAYVSIEPKNIQHIIEACYIAEAVGVGFEFPESAMHQFNERKVWRYVAGSPIDGGHYVPIVGRPALGYLTCVTWARRQVMTEAFFNRYVDEAWAYITQERINWVTGKTYEHITPAAIEEYLGVFGKLEAKGTVSNPKPS